MPRMVDLIRKSQLSSNMMHAAARGALAVHPDEMMEILVHLTLHNKVFGEQARMTLAGWDEKASIKVAGDPATHQEVLHYLITPKNVRPALLPALLENTAIKEEELTELASSGSRDVVEAMIVSPRVKKSAALKEALRGNPRLREHELEEEVTEVAPPPTPEPPIVTVAEPVAVPDQALEQKADEATVDPSAPAVAAAASTEADLESAAEDALAQALAHFLEENKVELSTVGEHPFQPIGGMQETLHSQESAAGEHPASAEASAGTAGSAASTTATSEQTKADHLAGIQHALRPVQHEERRETTLWKISKLDVKGRIHLAIRGTKEERSILIRDGTKLVALAVLDSPKISDPEVEGFAQQKNVLEAVLRAIPMKRRYAKNYAIMRNLVYNPRTPLDVSLGLMKGLLVHDLKNLSGNKEVSETIRKLALRMFRQKSQEKKKD
jgi:hypothetical protein